MADQPQLPHRPDFSLMSPDRLHIFLMIVFVLNGLLCIFAFYKYYDSRDKNEALDQALKLKDQSIAQLSFQVAQQQTYKDSQANLQPIGSCSATTIPLP